MKKLTVFQSDPESSELMEIPFTGRELWFTVNNSCLYIYRREDGKTENIAVFSRWLYAIVEKLDEAFEDA